jgi:hypothetical protein
MIKVLVLCVSSPLKSIDIPMVVQTTDPGMIATAGH